jgi:tartronate-semialdehyde synthase
MARMTAAEAAVRVLEKEGVSVAFGVPGAAGTDMITGLYTAQADSIPILCITGQAPRARLYKEDFQAVDIEAIAKPVTKWAVTVREPGLVPRVFEQAFHVMRSGRPWPAAGSSTPMPATSWSSWPRSRACR